MNDEPDLQYGYYPAPVEHNAVSYDQLWSRARERGTALMVVVDIPDYEAIFFCQLPTRTRGATGASPLLHPDAPVRGRAVANVMRLVGEKVAKAARE